MARDANNNVYFTYASSAYVAEQIVAAHANVTAVRGDFTDSGQLEDLSRQMLGWDVLVKAMRWAGKPEGIHFHKLTQEALLRSFTNNVLPTVSVTQKALETFCEKKSGRIITVLTSYVVGVPPLGYSLYASTKAYLHKWRSRGQRSMVRWASRATAYLRSLCAQGLPLAQIRG